MTAHALHLRRPAAPGELRGIRRAVDEWACANQLSADDAADLQLALGEAVANGVEHAYRNGTVGTVELELELQPGRVVSVRVCDTGCWRPVPDQPGYRGRGIAMIQTLATGFSMSVTGLGTEVCFEIALTS